MHWDVGGVVFVAAAAVLAITACLPNTVLPMESVFAKTRPLLGTALLVIGLALFAFMAFEYFGGPQPYRSIGGSLVMIAWLISSILEKRSRKHILVVPFAFVFATANIFGVVWYFTHIAVPDSIGIAMDVLLFLAIIAWLLALIYLRPYQSS